MAKTVAFWDNQLCERGTTVALYDYAYYNERVLGNRSVIIYPESPHNVEDVIEKFLHAFPDRTFRVADFAGADAVLAREGCGVFYVIKSGEYDGKVSAVCKTVVHCVFNSGQPHGAVYAAISPYIAAGRPVPVVPHMVNMPQLEGPARPNGFRARHGVPGDAIVFGRYGGLAQFDLGFVHRAVWAVAAARPDVYFVFVNTRRFGGGPAGGLRNVMFLDAIVDLAAKVEYIDSCDAMLWGRSDGETFGLSIAEFSVRNKPVFATRVGACAHEMLLGDRGIWYGPGTVERLLLDFRPAPATPDGRSWNAYSEYTPEKVMAIFDREFLQ